MSEMKGDRVVKEVFRYQDPFDIIARMPDLDEQDAEITGGTGWVLGWKSERLRNGSGMGWRGWEPFEFGDKYTGDNGEKLKAYVPDPPRRMRGPDHIDNLVRRADTVLCRLPAGAFDKAQMESAMISQQRVKGLENKEGVEVLPGVYTIEQGRRVDKKPNFGTGTELDKQLGSKLRKQ